jgi:hypothetical protein
MDADFHQALCVLQQKMVARGMSGVMQLRVPAEDVDRLRALLDMAPLPTPVVREDDLPAAERMKRMDLLEFLAQAEVIGP